MTHVPSAFQPKEMRSPRPSLRRLALLGATGSIGRQVCDLVERHPDRFALHAVIAGTDAAALDAVARRHPEAHALLANPGGSDAGRAARAIAEAVSDPDVDLVVVAAAGAAALAPTLSALDAGKDIALATKEVLVMAGELVRQRMRRHGSQIFPIDSEHSAIWQCLWGEKEAAVRRLILTGSGGPFLRRPHDAARPGGAGSAVLRGAGRDPLPGRRPGSRGRRARRNRPGRAERRERRGRSAVPQGTAAIRGDRAVGAAGCRNRRTR